MRKRLPRWTAKGLLNHDDLNKLAEAIEEAYGFEVDSSTGLTFSQSRVNRILGFTAQRVAAYAVVSSGGISAASGMTLGKGQIDLCYKDDSGVLQFYGGSSEDCYNSTTATAVKGDIIQVKWIDEDWALDTGSCD